MLYLTAKHLRYLMCVYRVTIAELATRLQITQTRIRYRREKGIDDPYVTRDWIQAITGKDPGPLGTPIVDHTNGIPQKDTER